MGLDADLRVSEARLFDHLPLLVWRESTWRACALRGEHLESTRPVNTRPRYEKNQLRSPVTGESGLLGANSGAEWGGRGISAPKQERARGGRIEGARVVLARHGRTAQLRGVPGGC